MFEKDDYIVMLYESSCNDQFSKNFIYKQRIKDSYLRPYLDNRGSDTNGLPIVNPSNPENWYYATKHEIDEYNKLGKPFNVTKHNYEPAYEIY